MHSQDIMDQQGLYCEDTQPDGYQQEHQIIRSPEGSQFLRYPCKARSVKICAGQKPHVAKYAYIDIPMNAKHGTTVLCSHPACLDSGRRFRWCEVCHLAVAKRNFNRRHGHGRVDSRSRAYRRTVEDDDDVSAIGSQVSFEENTGHVVPVHISHTNGGRNEPDTGVPSLVNMPLESHEEDIIYHIRARPHDNQNGRLKVWRAQLVALMARGPSTTQVNVVTAKEEELPSTTTLALPRHIYHSSISSFPCDESL